MEQLEMEPKTSMSKHLRESTEGFSSGNANSSTQLLGMTG